MMIHGSTEPDITSVKMDNSAKLKEAANGIGAGNDDVMNQLTEHVDKVSLQVNMLEQKVLEIERLYSSSSKKKVNPKSKDKARQITSLNPKKHSDRIAPSDTMQELMSQFGKIIDQVIQKKGARSSTEYIDAKDLGLHDCTELNGEARDFSAIKRRMESKDGTGYNHVREIYTDVRTVLKNAKRYNDEKSEPHVTATRLMTVFEEKWYILLPKIMQEEERVKDDQALQQSNHAQMAKDVNLELIMVEKHLNKLKERVLQKCRRMSTLEKRELGKALAKLSADELRQALEIVAQSNPAFQANAEEVDLDIDAQSEYTLRRLKYFILEVRKAQGNPSSMAIDKIDNDDAMNTTKPQNVNFKRKREILDAGGKSAKKKTK